MSRSPYIGVDTPWGPADSCEEIKPGIKSYNTPSHGGFHLSETRQAMLMAKFPFFRNGQNASRWYEEDCEVCAVVLCFASEFAGDELRMAAQIVRGCAKFEGEDHPQLHVASGGRWRALAKWLGEGAEGSAINAAIAEWERVNADLWERCSMGSLPRKMLADFPQLDETAWWVEFRRVKDRMYRSVAMPYPMERFYTSKELGQFVELPIRE